MVESYLERFEKDGKKLGIELEGVREINERRGKKEKLRKEEEEKSINEEIENEK